ncbi:hypothetical protein GCM10008014_00290 [Paenibacillus silvae]|uniref:Uncharacterized protein n=1 Tax=Paenibacillus silvae TaxID=1325358 RepID=A0ABQ1YWK2_9BACL|nr:hypothetical protein [Paenibacillus silvae]GGH41017.1 hypothetical protein GCM10008014_00290 [Paenibacillus silvae]
MFRKWISLLLSLTLALTGLFGTITPVLADENVQISIKADPKIDVALAVGNSSWNLKNFTNDLKSQLTLKGISSSSVNVQSVETKSVVADASNASLIFQSWKNFSILSGGYNAPAWTTSDYFISGDRLIRSNSGATRPASGYYDPKSFETTNATYSFTWGIDATSYGAFDHGEAGFLFRMQDENNYYAYLVDNHSACGNIFLDGGEAIVRVKNGTFEVLASTSFPQYYAGQKEDIKIVAEGSSIKVYRNGSLRLSVDDGTYTKGGHGFYVWDQYGAYFSNISVESESTKKFTEVIRQPIWREGSNRFLVNLENNVVSDLDDAQASAEILTRMISNEVSYVGLGTTTNQTQVERLVARNNSNGIFIDNSVYSSAMDQLADYIASKVRRVGNEQYMILDEDNHLEVNPSSLQQNTQTADHPEGRWKIEHDSTYFENGSGQVQWSGKWQKDLPLTFDKPGRYELWFGSEHPNPQFLYVHRRPVADFTLKVTKGSANYSIDVKDQSYDPDKEFSSNKGISQMEWKWRETTATTWNDGLIPSNLPVGKDYLFGF